MTEEFLAWYALYPRKESKPDAWKAWGQMRCDLPTVREMCMTNTAAHAAAWKAEGRKVQYMPYPATFLRSGAWTDAPETEAETGYVENGIRLEVSE
jgi:hypothetical protein